MATRDDDRFKVKLAPPKTPAGSRSERFVSTVLRQVSKSGAIGSGVRRTPSGSNFGRGRVAAGRAGHSLGAVARRVVVKSRYVVLSKAGAKSVSTHLRYIEREGVTREGGPGQAYGPETDRVELKAFEERGRGDRHQFRIIVSVEDAEQLNELHTYTREFMQRMATDLETRLDWVAVDHWDTDNPHTHVVLRGRAANGQDLVIAPDYMAHGMRMRASELATEWLGPRTELEIRQGLEREVEQERLTSLDRALLRQASMEIVDLTASFGDGQRQTVLRARLQQLEALNLVERIDTSHWRLSPRMESTLAAMGERGDILRTMHKALHGRQRDCMIPESEPMLPIIGRIIAKGLADELNDHGYLVVDAIDGRAHYVRLPASVDLAELPVSGIVKVASAGQERAVDRAIVDMVRDGVYRTSDHLAQARSRALRDPQATVDVHVNRLEALRRAGVAERVAEGVWRVPPDFASRAMAFDAKRSAGITVELRSRLPIEQQVRAIGATWLDRQLVAGGRELMRQGFGAEVREAMRSRATFLVEQGLARRLGQRVVLGHDLLATMEGRELALVGKTLEAETGLLYRPTTVGEQINGIYRRSVSLVSGRYALLDDGLGFRLLPWRPVLERRLGSSVSASTHAHGVSWHLGRQPALTI